MFLRGLSGRPELPSAARFAHFENDQVIFNAPHPGINIPGAATGKNWHNHKLNRVMIYFHTGGEKLTYLDGTVEDLKWEPGTVKWSPAADFTTRDSFGLDSGV